MKKNFMIFIASLFAVAAIVLLFVCPIFVVTLKYNSYSMITTYSGGLIFGGDVKAAIEFTGSNSSAATSSTSEVSGFNYYGFFSLLCAALGILFAYACIFIKGLKNNKGVMLFAALLIIGAAVLAYFTHVGAGQMVLGDSWEDTKEYVTPYFTIYISAGLAALSGIMVAIAAFKKA